MLDLDCVVVGGGVGLAAGFIDRISAEVEGRTAAGKERNGKAGAEGDLVISRSRGASSLCWPAPPRRPLVFHDRIGSAGGWWLVDLVNKASLSFDFARCFVHATSTPREAFAGKVTGPPLLS
jgi:hypothetical protein